VPLDMQGRHVLACISPPRQARCCRQLEPRSTALAAGPLHLAIGETSTLDYTTMAGNTAPLIPTMTQPTECSCVLAVCATAAPVSTSLPSRRSPHDAHPILQPDRAILLDAPMATMPC
jgi:hypothetical protein